MGAITVTRYLKQLGDNAEEETECAKDLLANNVFIYEVLGDSVRSLDCYKSCVELCSSLKCVPEPFAVN